MFHTPAGIACASIAFLVCAFALWRGRTPERLTAVAVLLGWFSTPFVQSSQYVDPEWGMFWVDVLMLVFLTVMVVRYRRIWLVFATAFELLMVASHVAMLIDWRISMNSYLAGLAIWSFALLGALLVGTLGARRSGTTAHEEPRPSH